MEDNAVGEKTKPAGFKLYAIFLIVHYLLFSFNILGFAAGFFPSNQDLDHSAFIIQLLLPFAIAAGAVVTFIKLISVASLAGKESKICFIFTLLYLVLFTQGLRSSCHSAASGLRISAFYRPEIAEIQEWLGTIDGSVSYEDISFSIIDEEEYAKLPKAIRDMRPLYVGFSDDEQGFPSVYLRWGMRPQYWGMVIGNETVEILETPRSGNSRGILPVKKGVYCWYGN